MYTAKLARSGMKGRKRDTRILLIVLTLSFIFTTISTILISSMEYTDEFQKSRSMPSGRRRCLTPTNRRLKRLRPALTPLACRAL